MGDATPDELIEGLTRVCSRVGLSPPSGLTRLTGGATMESWRFEAGGSGFVLRRAPSLAFMEGRPFGHDVEAAVIEAARSRSVTAPEVVAVLEPDDAIGSGFVMRALPGTPNPKDILQTGEPGRLLAECASNLAHTHTLGPKDLPEAVPSLDYRESIADLRQQFEEAGGDRPIIALGLRWLEDNCPSPIDPVLTHGDYRMGNILVDDGWLTGVLDWELAHFGDYHEDLAFGCMAVWRFARYDLPALGLGSLEDYFDLYEMNGGRKVDQARFRFWMIYRTVWWALGCLKMAAQWRSGADRMLERSVISRRTSEQELDLLLLLEEDAPEAERARPVLRPWPCEDAPGEASASEIAIAISEWLGTIKNDLGPHDRFQLAVARNALGIIERDARILPNVADLATSSAVIRGEQSLEDRDLLATLRGDVLAKVSTDSPKYPALAHARKKWTGEE